MVEKGQWHENGVGESFAALIAMLMKCSRHQHGSHNSGSYTSVDSECN